MAMLFLKSIYYIHMASYKLEGKKFINLKENVSLEYLDI